MFANAVNTVILVGRLTKDAQLGEIERKDADPLPKLTFTLAVDRPGKDAGADFIRCAMVGPLASSLYEHLVKGKQVALSGSLRIDSSRTVSATGEVTYRSYTTVNAVSIKLLGGPRRGEEGGEPDEEGEPAGVGASVGDDEIPF